MMQFLISILALSSVTAELQHVFLLGPGDGSGGHVETLEIYYSEDTDPRFVTKDNGSVFLGSHKDSTVYGYVGGQIHQNGTILSVICGGTDKSQQANINCYSYNQTDFTWHVAPSLKQKRAFASSVNISSTSMMVLGGRGEAGATLSSTEVWSPEAGDWVRGPELPWPLEQSCVVSLNTSHVLIIGGLTSLEPIQRLDSAYFFNIRTGAVQKTPPMHNGARSGHGCLAIDFDIGGRVLVVGGESYPKDVSKSAEIFDIAREEWINLHPLPRPLYGSPAVVDIGTRMVPGLKLVIGGYSDTGISEGILVFDMRDWFNLNVTMKYPRAIFPTIELK